MRGKEKRAIFTLKERPRARSESARRRPPAARKRAKSPARSVSAPTHRSAGPVLCPKAVLCSRSGRGHLSTPGDTALARYEDAARAHGWRAGGGRRGMGGRPALPALCLGIFGPAALWVARPTRDPHTTIQSQAWLAQPSRTLPGTGSSWLHHPMCFLLAPLPQDASAPPRRRPGLTRTYSVPSCSPLPSSPLPSPHSSGPALRRRLVPGPGEERRRG